ELAKMDGAIILSADATRVARANVHLMPSASIPTTETGTRHRTAERVARSVDVPVMSISAAMGIVTVYRGDDRHTLQPASRLHERVSQALQTLQRFRHRFDLAVTALSVLEVEDTVTVRDVAAVLQPAELVVRITEEIEIALVELGDDGRLLRLQLDELVDGVDQVRRLVVRDYSRCSPGGSAGSGAAANGDEGTAGSASHGAPVRSGETAHGAPLRSAETAHGAPLRSAETAHGAPLRSADLDRCLVDLGRLSTDELLDPRRVAVAIGISTSKVDLDAPLEPHGYRLLHRLPRFPEAVVDRIVEHFSGLQRIMRASVHELEEVGGVGESRARSVKDGLARLAEANILDRYT
ncbi:MAG: DNA integrity scanning diadenylate cyclase DisA, partial [Actinomycetota bacterium]|nr:DNA integrity scanning diadenylate cyclase DisA [Actinomycetota bacterium]